MAPFLTAGSLAWADKLLAAERRGRSLVAGKFPRPGDIWRFECDQDDDAMALKAAARWAKRLGASVESLPGPQNRLIIVRDSNNIEMAEIPEPDVAWALPLRSASPFVRPVDGNSPLLSAAQCREVDRKATFGMRVPGLCLMENAAVDAVILGLDMLPHPAGDSVLVLAGGGNNGGDGLAMARGLAAMGVRTDVAILKDPSGIDGDAGINLRLLREISGAAVHDLHADPSGLEKLLPRRRLLVDALLGTGFKGKLAPEFAAAINAINASGLPILALDVPSGLNCDDGTAEGPVVHAARCLTFAAVKPGFLSGMGPETVGNLYLGDIGAPNEAYPYSCGTIRTVSQPAVPPPQFSPWPP
ncbi:MAG: NAD(P)H-hydrate epimerase [Planctomycetota bacterium]|nr:NAD(P)H-hydrate epimerase [Planctomycetota bacterium]